MIYQNKPCLPYFSSVVKNVANTNIEIKKLVYIYLLHYAESDPDLALLSVNAIQKSLTDQNPQIRALALRTMSGMRVPVISQIVSLAIKRGVGDMSPHVRKAAALAIPKCYQLEPNTLPQLLDYLSALLADKQYFVVGPAVQSFLQICPDRIDLVHKHYRGLVKKLVDMDEWSQIATLRLLMIYCRRCFPRKTQVMRKVNKKGFYEDEQDETEVTGEEQILDPDLELFLKACQPLLQSRNAAVIVAVTSCLLLLGTPEYFKEAIGPLVGLTRGPAETQEVALCNIASVALDHAALFVPYTSDFFIRGLDAPQIWRLKMELLTLVFPHCALNLKSVILSELEHFAHSADFDLTRESVRAIGRCAQSDPDTSPRCFKVLLNQITSFDNVLVSEVLTVIRHLIQQDPSAHKKTVVRLARNLDKTTSPEARATIVWLVGEYAGMDAANHIAPDVLRILAKGFADESEEAKQQILLLAAKVYLNYLQSQAQNQQSGAQDTEEQAPRDEQQEPDTNQVSEHPIAKLWSYILLLVRYDTSYDLRDRARLFKALLSNPSSTQLASLLLMAPKPVPHSASPSEARSGLMLGSTTLVLGRDIAGLNGLPGYEDLPDWVEARQEPDAKLREGDDVEREEYGAKKPTVAASARLDEAVKEQGLEKVVQGGKGKTLDDWLEETESEGETESESEEESEGETDEEGSTEEEDDEDGKQERRALVS